MGRKRLVINTGDQFGRLTVTDVLMRRRANGKSQTHVMARCSCGAGVREYNGSHVVNGVTRSCGCLHRERTSEANGTHRGSGTRLYSMWRGMRRRCSNPSDGSYFRYGGRGIVVCDEWQDFAVFREWALSNGYEQGLSLDRIDNDGPYHPDNARWATYSEQAVNTRSNVWLEAFGESKTLSQWAADERCGCSEPTLRARVQRLGWNTESAITTPPERRTAPAPAYDRLYNIWQGMKQRCYNPTSGSYLNYGARGVTVCEEWRGRSRAFKDWALAHGYADDLSLDRIDGDGPYSPGNCRWATSEEQGNNRRGVVLITAFGESMSAQQWTRDPRCQVAADALLRRVRAGWDVERAISAPPRGRGSS